MAASGKFGKRFDGTSGIPIGVTEPKPPSQTKLGPITGYPPLTFDGVKFVGNHARPQTGPEISASLARVIGDRCRLQFAIT